MAGVDAWTVLGEIGSVDEASDIVPGRGTVLTQGPDVVVGGIGIGNVRVEAVGVVVETEGGGRVMEGEGKDIECLSG